MSDPIQGPYTLEVSSPGWDRPLFTRQQYQRYLGEQVVLRLAYPVEGKRNCSGRLIAAQDAQVEVELRRGEVLKVPYAAIRKARLAAESEQPVPRRNKPSRA